MTRIYSTPKLNIYEIAEYDNPEGIVSDLIRSPPLFGF